MPPSFQTATTAATTGDVSVTSLSVTSPACAAGDLLLLAFQTNNATASGVPSGWSLVANVDSGPTSSGDSESYYLYTKTATSTDAAGTTYTPASTSTTQLTIACLSYSPGSIETSATNGSASGAARVTAWNSPTVTVSDVRTIVEFWAEAVGGTNGAFSGPGVPTNIRADASVSGGSLNHHFSVQRVVDEAQLSAGTTLARTVTCGIGGGWASITIALASPPGPIITASLTQNNMDVSIPVTITNPALGPFTYLIDYNDGITDSLTTSSTTHTFTHTYSDTTPKTIKVQATELTSLTSTITDGFAGPVNQQLAGRTTGDGHGTWVVPQGSFLTVNPGVQSVATQSIGYVETGATDGTVQCDITPDGLNQYYALMARYVDNSNYWYFEVKQTANLGRIVHNTVGSPFVVASGLPIGGAGSFTMKIVMVGTTMQFYNGATLLYTDTSGALSTATKHGIWAGNNGFGHLFANWSFTPTSATVYSNVVLLHPVWVTGSAINNSTRTAFI